MSESTISDETVNVFLRAAVAAGAGAYISGGQGRLEVDDEQVRAGLAAALAGRVLLPSGGEVKEQWAVRWHLVGGGVDEQDCYRNARETAEQRARRLAARPPMGVERGEAQMRRIYTGPWSPVLADNTEATR